MRNIDTANVVRVERAAQKNESRRVLMSRYSLVDHNDVDISASSLFGIIVSN